MEPITREEALMNGDYIEPITREEMILAGEDIEPITRREWFLKKYRGGGDVEVVTLHANENTTYVAPEGQAYSPVEVEVPVPTLTSLEVDENGTYTAPTGTAYNEVEVDVPLPENAYLLKDIENTPTAIATFSDGANLPMPKLEVGIEPVQDLHGYDNPWVGGAGKNKFNSSATTNLRDFSRSEETFTNTYTDTRSTVRFGVVYYSNGTQIGISNDITIAATGRKSLTLIIPSGTDKLRIRNSGSTRDLYFEYPFSGEGNYVISADFTSVNPTTVGGLVIKNIQLEEGSTATSYAPYSNICPILGWDEVNVTVADATTDPTVSNIYTIDLDGTRYGGKVDLVSGVMTVDRAYVDLGTLNWTKENNHFYSNFLLDANPPSTNSQPANILCEAYKNMAYSQVITETNDASICLSNSKRIYIYDSTKTSLDDSAFQSAMNGVQLVYELATPITIQLTPTPVISLDGVNNVWADSGDVLDGKYFSKEV